MFEFENEKARLFTGADYYANRDVFDKKANEFFGNICYVADNNKPVEIGKDNALFFLTKCPGSAREWADIMISLDDVIDVDKIRHGHVTKDRDEYKNLDDIEFWAFRILDVCHFALWDENKKKFRERARYSAPDDWSDVTEKRDLSKKIRDLIIKDLKRKRLSLTGKLSVIEEEIWL